MRSSSDIEFLKLLLSDSNLPTGGFVASSGLESFIGHGQSHGQLTHTALIDFLRFSCDNTASTTLAYINGVHSIIRDTPSPTPTRTQLEQLKRLDGVHDAQMLNHAAKRASKAQGMAILTLHAKSFGGHDVIRDFRHAVRSASSEGHLAICWGLMTAVLGMPSQDAQHLHLFLHARSLLSAAVRLNVLGPYAAQKILLHDARDIVDSAFHRCCHVRVGNLDSVGGDYVYDTDDADDHIGPATTWPLIELIGSRHDLLHTRIFNS
ncbi:hypothetical protein E3P77_02722 [Wallemia ichthyophaga]|nr:hypothetical protein E3P77_02722 [Wallemia ichthyophaga]